MKFPNTGDELLNELEKIFPEPIISEDATLDEIKYAYGQRSVVLYIRNWRDRSIAPPAPIHKRGAGRVRRQNTENKSG